MAWLAQCAGTISAASVYVQFPNFVLGSCWFFISVAEDITQDVLVFNVIAKTTSVKNLAKSTKQLNDVLKSYLGVKE